MLTQMAWFPILVLTVFGVVSIAFMMQMPKEKPVHNIKRVIRGTGVEPVVEPVVEVVDVVDVKHPSVEPVGVVETETEPKDVVELEPVVETEPVKVVETNVFRDIPGSGFEQIYNLMKSKNTALCVNTHVLKGENSKEPDVHICLDNIHPPCVVYSFGIAYNWIFDDFMIDQGCHVFSFDPSMTLGKHKRHKNHLFEPIGVGPKSGTHTGKSTLYGGKTNYEVLSLQDMMKRYDHDHLDMIRMDVESAEWNVLQQWTHDNLWHQIDQLLLEIHMYENQKMHAETLMDIPMSLFHTAKNLWNNHRVFKDMTQVYEIGFKSPRSINIVCTVKNRYKYVKFLAESLKWLKAYDHADIYIFNDGSTEFTSNELKQWMPFAVVHETNLNHPDMNTRWSWESFLNSMSGEILVNLDSDMLLHPKWYEFIIEHMPGSNTALSLYNSKNHKSISCNEFTCKKEITGAAGTVLHRSLVDEILQNVNTAKDKPGAFDWGYLDYFKKHGITITVPKNSLALHYGMYGAHGSGNHVEVANTFDFSPFPDYITKKAKAFLDNEKPDRPIDTFKKTNMFENKKHAVVLTSVYNYANDPQRGHMIKCDFDYIANFYNSVVYYGLNAIIMHNCFEKTFVDKYTTTKIRFFKSDVQTELSTNDFRFVRYNLYLENNHYEYYLFVDASDVFFNGNPFESMVNKHTLFVSHDSGTFNSKAWQVERCYGTDGEMWDQNVQLLNAGVWGGDHKSAKCVLECIENQFQTVVKGRSNCNMPVYNWCVHFGGCNTNDDVKRIGNPFRKECRRNHVVIHNKCRDTEGKVCLVKQDDKLVLDDLKGSRCKRLSQKHHDNNVHVYIDLGARDGDTLLALKSYYSKCIAFEPNPNMFRQLNQKEYPNCGEIKLYKAAAWTHEGKITFYEDKRSKEQWGSSIVKRVDMKDSQRFKLTVDSIDIVQTIKAEDSNAIVLKIDIEGAEYDLIRHLLQYPGVFKKVKYVLVEWHGRYMPNDKGEEYLLENKIKKLGVSIFKKPVIETEQQHEDPFFNEKT